MKLEKLLNKLIEMWRKPWGRVYDVRIEVDNKVNAVNISVCQIDDDRIYQIYTLNDLVSIDSWLRQFVVEKKLYKRVKPNQAYILELYTEDHNTYNKDMLEYRLMLSSMQKDKEAFILNNINITDE